MGSTRQTAVWLSSYSVSMFDNSSQVHSCMHPGCRSSFVGLHTLHSSANRFISRNPPHRLPILQKLLQQVRSNPHKYLTGSFYFPLRPLPSSPAPFLPTRAQPIIGLSPIISSCPARASSPALRRVAPKIARARASHVTDFGLSAGPTGLHTSVLRERALERRVAVCSHEISREPLLVAAR